MDEKVVILCGGRGMRLNEETEFRPKPLVKIGGLPILWHIMTIYSRFGYKDFILPLGYRGEMIKNFFLNYDSERNDFTLNLRSKKMQLHNGEGEDWNITFVDTGANTDKGGRIKKIEKYITGDHFHMTYGDGLGNINLHKLKEHYVNVGKLSTLTTVIPKNRFGILDTQGHKIRKFIEKPLTSQGINGGYMILNTEVFDYIKQDCDFEAVILPQLAKEGKLSHYPHKGFWYCMDTYQDYLTLQDLAKKENPPPWFKFDS